MDAITNIPGLQHISEDIFKLLDKKSLMNCGLINSSWKNILNQPSFWLMKMKREEIPEEVQISWKMLAQEVNDEQILNEFVLILTKLVKSNPKKIKQGFALFQRYFFTMFDHKDKSLPHASMVKPLEIVVELKEANKYPDCMKFILEHIDSNSKVDVKMSGKIFRGGEHLFTNLTPIQLAALYGQTESVEMLKLKYDCANVKDHDNKSLITLAAFKDHLETIKVLANFNDTPNAPDAFGNTPMMVAASRGHFDIVHFLQEHTDNPFAPNNNGNNSIHIAALEGQLEVLKYLVGLTDTPLAPNNFGITPIHYAALNGHVECLKFLVRLTTSPITSTIDGRTPIHLAAFNGHTECLKVLVRLTNSPNVPMNNGKTPISLARKKGHKNTERFLKQYCQLMNRKWY